MRTKAATIAFALATLFTHAPVEAAPLAETQEPIKLAQFNVTDADFITVVFGSVLEKAGYNVEYVKVDVTALFTALELGDVPMSPAIWGSLQDLIDKTLATGKVEKTGTIGVKVREGWWYPNYVADVCPGLPDWIALTKPGCIEALSTPETGGKIRYIGTPADWAPFDVERIKSLGLSVEIVPSGSPAAMVATLQGAVQRKQPIIGFGFVPHWFYGDGQGSFVNFPKYDPACRTDPAWGINPKEVGDCDLAEGEIHKLVNIAAEAKTPAAFRILNDYKISTDDVAKGIYQVEQEGMTLDQAAAKWLDANEATWSAWLK